jgi:hypothetical protein
MNPARRAKAVVASLITGMAAQVYRLAPAGGYGSKDTSSMANFFGSFAGVHFHPKWEPLLEIAF